MYKTLEMMKSIVIGYEKQLQLKELFEEYLKNSSPNILAYLYVENFGAILKVASQYNLLNSEDIASYCLQELDKSIHKYDFNSSCSFLSYFLICFKNRLRTELEYCFHKHNYVNKFIEPLEDYENILEYSENYDLFDIKNYNLTEKEIEQCKLLDLGYSVKEIAKYFNTSIQTIYNRNKKIAKKINYLV